MLDMIVFDTYYNQLLSSSSLTFRTQTRCLSFFTLATDCSTTLGYTTSSLAVWKRWVSFVPVDCRKTFL
jgi:hypothetical protein